MVLHDVVLRELELLSRKLFKENKKVGQKEELTRCSIQEVGGHFKYKVLSHYLLIICYTCTLASIKMKANEIKLKQEGK